MLLDPSHSMPRSSETSSGKLFGKGRYLNDVRTEGEGGFKNCWILRTNSTDRLREMRMKGEGVKKSKNFADVI